MYAYPKIEGIFPGICFPDKKGDIRQAGLPDALLRQSNCSGLYVEKRKVAMGKEGSESQRGVAAPTAEINNPDGRGRR